MSKKFEYVDDNPGSYFGMLVENWKELNESNVEYIKWVQLPNKKWKMWGSSSSSKLDSDFLDKARKQNGINYLDAKISKNGEYPDGVSEKDIETVDRFKKEESLKEDKFVPQDKISKKAQKELNDKKRGTWGNTNPVTRVQPNKKAYDRKRDKKIEDEALEESKLNESSGNIKLDDMTRERLKEGATALQYELDDLFDVINDTDSTFDDLDSIIYELKNINEYLKVVKDKRW